MGTKRPTKSGTGKPPWEPTAAVRTAMDALLIAASRCDKHRKGVIPRNLQAVLKALDDVVLADIPEIDSKFSGYTETIAEELARQGKINVTAGVIRNCIKRLRLRADAEAALECKTSNHRLLLAAILSRCVTTEAPDGQTPDRILLWDNDLRALLYSTNEAWEEWVGAENKYRKALTNDDKKSMEEREYDALKWAGETGEHASFIRSVTDQAQGSQQGDAATVRKFLSLEKSRVSRKKAKAAKVAKGDDASASLVAPGTMPDTVVAEAATSVAAKAVSTGLPLTPTAVAAAGRANDAHPGVKHRSTTSTPAAAAAAAAVFSSTFTAPPVFSFEHFYDVPP